jgi:hypothetical protein
MVVGNKVRDRSTTSVRPRQFTDTRRFRRCAPRQVRCGGRRNGKPERAGQSHRVEGAWECEPTRCVRRGVTNIMPAHRHASRTHKQGGCGLPSRRHPGPRAPGSEVALPPGRLRTARPCPRRRSDGDAPQPADGAKHRSARWRSAAPRQRSTPARDTPAASRHLSPHGRAGGAASGPASDPPAPRRRGGAQRRRSLRPGRACRPARVSASGSSPPIFGGSTTRRIHRFACGRRLRPSRESTRRIGARPMTQTPRSPTHPWRTSHRNSSQGRAVSAPEQRRAGVRQDTGCRAEHAGYG